MRNVWRASNGGKGRVSNSLLPGNHVSHAEAKAARERAFFGMFLKKRGLPCSDVESRSPPEPDILYSPTDGERVAFELVEFCSEEMAEAITEDLRSGDCTYIRSSDPSFDILRGKLLKRYESEYPIELLCYNNGRLVSPDNFVVERLRWMSFDKGPFRRIWYSGRSDYYKKLYDRHVGHPA